MVSFDVESAVAIIGGLILILGTLVGSLRWFIKYTTKTAGLAKDTAAEAKKEIQEVERQVKTSNGKTLGEIIEALSKSTNDQFQVLTHIAESNRTMIELMGKRMDEHMTWGGHHSHDPKDGT